MESFDTLAHILVMLILMRKIISHWKYEHESWPSVLIYAYLFGVNVQCIYIEVIKMGWKNNFDSVSVEKTWHIRCIHGIFLDIERMMLCWSISAKFIWCPMDDYILILHISYIFINIVCHMRYDEVVHTGASFICQS